MSGAIAFQINKKYAIEGSGSVGLFIRETGKYEGVIVWAREFQQFGHEVPVPFSFWIVDRRR